MARITAELTAGTYVTISNGRHTWRADEPVAVKGTDLAPNPYELLLGSLAACTCITLSLYAQHKGIALKSVTASYEYDRVHSADCADCDDNTTAFIDRVTSYVRIAGDLDDARKKRLSQVVERCPVHKTLANGVHIVDRVEFA